MKRLIFMSLSLIIALGAASCKKDNPEGNAVKFGIDKVTPLPEAVDLGLIITNADGSTYKLNWASFNLGASKEEEVGDYYTWGGLAPYKHFGETDAYTDNASILPPERDAVCAKLGGKWRMPTSAEMESLIATKNDDKNYKWTVELTSGADNRIVFVGFRITSLKPETKGNSVFFPVTNYVHEGEFSSNVESAEYGCYWSSNIGGTSSTAAKAMVITGGIKEKIISLDNQYYTFKNYSRIGSFLRSDGLCIRPVCLE